MRRVRWRRGSARLGGLAAHSLWVHWPLFVLYMQRSIEGCREQNLPISSKTEARERSSLGELYTARGT